MQWWELFTAVNEGGGEGWSTFWYRAYKLCDIEVINCEILSLSTVSAVWYYAYQLFLCCRSSKKEKTKTIWMNLPSYLTSTRAKYVSYAHCLYRHSSNSGALLMNNHGLESEIRSSVEEKDDLWPACEQAHDLGPRASGESRENHTRESRASRRESRACHRTRTCAPNVSLLVG